MSTNNGDWWKNFKNDMETMIIMDSIRKRNQNKSLNENPSSFSTAHSSFDYEKQIQIESFEDVADDIFQAKDEICKYVKTLMNGYAQAFVQAYRIPFIKFNNFIIATIINFIIFTIVNKGISGNNSHDLKIKIYDYISDKFNFAFYSGKSLFSEEDHTVADALIEGTNEALYSLALAAATFKSENMIVEFSDTVVNFSNLLELHLSKRYPDCAFDKFGEVEFLTKFVQILQDFVKEVQDKN